MNKKLHTQFGTATINANGYYDIRSKKQGNEFKTLHTLIWEHFYNMEIPKGYVIHHKNGNKLDNCILNLQLLKENEHLKLHNTGENNPMYGKTHKKESMLDMSNSKTTTGYFRVYKDNSYKHKQGFIWVYGYMENGKRKKITSVSLDNLEHKVKSQGLLWTKFN